MTLLYKNLSRRVLLTYAAMKRRITTDARQILVSPPLKSIDFPDIWTSSSFPDYSFITTSYGTSPFRFNPPHMSSPFSPVQIHLVIVFIEYFLIWVCLVSDDLTLLADTPQTATVIDGRAIAEEITSGITSEVRRMKNSIGNVPGLAVILVGQGRDSQTYVRKKLGACEEAGIQSKISTLPENCTEDQVLNALSCFREDPSIHGILVQLPLPQHLDEEKILNSVHLEKDVDGFHPINMGNLAMGGREPLFLPCTPKGCIELLIRSGVEISGKKAVVIGRSNIVGLPTSLLLQRHHAIVSVVHAFTRNPEQITREADIVIAAAGVPNLVRGSWLKPGAVVLDVGTNLVEDPSCEYGHRLIGDVCYEEASRVASAITPVPGGVGPVTVAMLLLNTLESAKRAYNFT